MLYLHTHARSYCNCDDRFNSNLAVTNVILTSNRLQFTISASTPTPLPAQCTQDLNKVEINTCKQAAGHVSYSATGLPAPFPRQWQWQCRSALAKGIVQRPDIHALMLQHLMILPVALCCPSLAQSPTAATARSASP